MWNTFKYTLLWIARTPGIMIWALLFPLILSSVFMMMFGPLDETAEMDPVRIAVVQPDDSIEGEAFSTFIDAMSGDDGLFDVTYADTQEDAERIVKENSDGDDAYTGLIVLENGEPHAFVTASTSPNGGMGEMKSAILALAMDEYASRSYIVQDLLKTDPNAFNDPAVAASMFEPVRATVQVQVTENQPKESTRFYFALLGMAALFGANMGLYACQRLKGNTSALGARRTVGATSHSAAIAATLLAAWLLSFLCLIVAYVYLRLTGTLDFAGRDIECIAAIAVSSLMATSLGCAISAIPHVPEEGKTGILTGIVCFASFFAGLYGEPIMELADRISASFPAADWINPATQISQTFYSIMYYDTAGPLLGHLAILTAMAILLFIVSARSMRRQRYASI